MYILCRAKEAELYSRSHLNPIKCAAMLIDTCHKLHMIEISYWGNAELGTGAIQAMGDAGNTCGVGLLKTQPSELSILQTWDQKSRIFVSLPA